MDIFVCGGALFGPFRFTPLIPVQFSCIPSILLSFRDEAKGCCITFVLTWMSYSALGSGFGDLIYKHPAGLTTHGKGIVLRCVLFKQL